MPKRPEEDEDPYAFDEKPTLGSRLLDILAAGAKGYGEGAGGSNIPEASFARSFSSGFEGGKASRKEGRLNRALTGFQESEDYKALTPTEKAALRVDPQGFLKERSERSGKSQNLVPGRLSDLNPNIDPKLDRDIMLNESQALAVQGRKDARARDEENRRSREEQADERRKDIASRNMDEQVRKLGVNFDRIGAPDAISALMPIAELVKPKENIPGFGPAESAVPGILEQFLNPKGQAARQLVQGLSNVKIKNQSGAAVTVPEFDRFLKAFGSGLFKTEDQLRNGLQQALNEYRKRVDNAMGGVKPEVRQRFFENAGIDDYATTLGGLNFGGFEAKAGGQKQGGGAVEDPLGIR